MTFMVRTNNKKKNRFIVEAPEHKKMKNKTNQRLIIGVNERRIFVDHQRSEMFFK